MLRKKEIGRLGCGKERRERGLSIGVAAKGGGSRVLGEHRWWFEVVMTIREKEIWE